MKIGNLEIGEDNPTRIIAELGTLHYHESQERILDVIGQCFKAGADLVKLQFINPYTAWWATEDQRFRYKSLFIEWTIPKLNQLMRESNKIGPVFASFFDWIFFNVEVPAIKLGYKARYMPNLALEAFNSDLPVIISCDEFSRQLYPYHPRAKYLWVDPNYPMKKSAREAFSYLDHINYHGFSLHTNNLEILKDCIHKKPELLEVHVQGENASGPDTSFALTIDQLAEISQEKPF